MLSFNQQRWDHFFKGLTIAEAQDLKLAPLASSDPSWVYPKIDRLLNVINKKGFLLDYFIEGMKASKKTVFKVGDTVIIKEMAPKGIIMEAEGDCYAVRIPGDSVEYYCEKPEIEHA